MSKLKLKLSLLGIGLGILPTLIIAEEGGNPYLPLGMRVGSVKISPSIENENDWSDNIYSNQTDAKSDFIFHFKPTVKANTEWRRHALNFAVGTDAMFYTTYDKEDKQNTFLNFDGRLDVMKDSFATAKFYYKDMREDRGSPDSQSRFLAASPLENETIGGTLGYEHKINRVKVNVSHDIQQLNYIDGVDGTGQPLSNPNHERSRMVNTSEIRLGYELFSGYEAYIKGSYNITDYDGVFVSQGGLDRSSTGYNIASGVKVDLTHKLTGDAHIGYRVQDYKSTQLPDISGVGGGLNLQWMPTKLTTINAGVDRQINETTQVGLSGFFSTAFTASINHELLRNLQLNLHTGYTDNDYQGSLAINRQEDSYSAGFYIKYLLNRNFNLKAGYDYKGRAVNNYTGAGAGSDYDINNVYFTLTGQI
jgi:hypothetical protein